MLAVLGVLARCLGPKMPPSTGRNDSRRCPANAPPKWIFRNITAIRENTDRILQLLGPARTGPAGSAATRD